MKTGSFILLSILGLAAAQPRGKSAQESRNEQDLIDAGHRHARFHHAKRDLVTDTVTVVATAPAAVVYVDPAGKVLYTSEAVQAAAAAPTPAPSSSSSVEENEGVPLTLAYTHPAPSPSPSTSSSSTPPPAPSTSAKPETTSEAPAPATTTPSKTTALAGGSSGYIGATSAPSADGFSQYGLSYSPYKADGTCMTQDEVSADFAKFPDFGFVRSYGCDCNQVSTMLTAAKAKGMKVFLGVFDLTQVQSEITQMVTQVKASGGWDSVWGVAIGNEDVNQGKADAATVVAALNAGRKQLRAAGYSGPVVHVDTFNQVIDHPELCENSDFAAANCHAFFDPNTDAAGAGAFVLKQAQAVSKACGGQTTWITETGWPNGGAANEQAVPSLANQQTALNKIKSSFPGGNVVMFSAFNDDWKKNSAGTFDAEQHWGILDANLRGF